MASIGKVYATKLSQFQSCQKFKITWILPTLTNTLRIQMDLLQVIISVIDTQKLHFEKYDEILSKILLLISGYLLQFCMNQY